MGGKPLLRVTEGETLGILAPSTGCNSFPPAVIGTFMSAVEGATKWHSTQTFGGGEDQEFSPTTQWMMPCNLVAELKLTFNGTEFSLKPAEFISVDPPGSGTCFSLIGASPGGRGCEGAGGVPFLGLSFLRTVYSIWDPSVPRVSLAKLKPQNQELLYKAARPVQLLNNGNITSNFVRTTTAKRPVTEASVASPAPEEKDVAHSWASATVPGALLSALVLLLLLCFERV